MIFANIQLRVVSGVCVIFITAGLYFYHSSSTEAGTKLNYNACFDDVQQNSVDLNEINEVIRSLDISDNDLNKLMLRSNCHIKIKDYELALEDVNKAISLNSKFGLAHQTRAKIYFLLNDYNKAISDLNYSIEHHLGDVDDHLLLVENYKALGQLNDAERILKDKLTYSPINHPGYKSDGSIVRTAYDEVLLYLALSDVLQQQNKIDESVNVLIEAADRSNGSVELFDSLLSLLESRNNQVLIQKYKDERCHIPNIQISKYCKELDT